MFVANLFTEKKYGITRTEKRGSVHAALDLPLLSGNCEDQSGLGKFCKSPGSGLLYSVQQRIPFLQQG